MIKSKILICVVASLGFTGCAGLGEVANTGVGISQAVGYSPKQLNDGVKEALSLSVSRASDALGTKGGYSNNPNFKIPLPQNVQNISKTLRQYGLGSYIDNIELLVNKGAEQAAEEAKPVLLNAVKAMSVTDAIGIVKGGNTAATDYFKVQTEQKLRQQYQGIMQNQLKSLGFYGEYQQLLNAYKLVPMANKPDLDIENQAINLGINALFSQIAVEEQKIRANPVEQGSVLLGAVFGKK